MVEFLKLNEIDNLNKYFETFNNYKTEINRSNDSKIVLTKQYSSNLDNFKRIYQFICDSINAFSTMTLKTNLNSTELSSDLNFVLAFLIKHCSLKYETKIGQFNSEYEATFLNLKFQASEFLRLMSRKDLNDSNVCSKVLELFTILLSDSNTILKYFSLECLDEYSKDNATNNNKIICQLSRSKNQMVGDKIKNYLMDVLIEPNFNEIVHYQDKTAQLVQKLRQIYKQTSGEKVNSDQDFDDGQDLDETMNAIMCAMDTTISNNTKNENFADEMEDESTKTKSEDLIEKIESDLEKLIQLYENGLLPDWLKQRLVNLSEKISLNTL